MGQCFKTQSEYQPGRAHKLEFFQTAAQPLEPTYDSLADRNSNLQLRVGAIFRYELCPAVRTAAILIHVPNRVSRKSSDSEPCLSEIAPVSPVGLEPLLVEQALHPTIQTSLIGVAALPNWPTHPLVQTEPEQSLRC